MNDLESIILSLFNAGYTKSEIASQLDETLAKASSETEKARHDALITEDAANVYAALAKYYTDKYNGSLPHYSIEDIIELLDALYSDGDDTCIICTETDRTDLDDVYDALKGYFLTEYDDPKFMENHCSLERLAQYLDGTYEMFTRSGSSPLDATLERIQASFYDYWYYTHNNTEIEITPEEITYMLEGYYNRDHSETTPQLLANVAELLDVYFMRTRKVYHGREIYKQFPHPDDFAKYLDSIEFSNDPNKTLMQAINTFLAKSIDGYKPETLTESFPEPKNLGDYVIMLYKTYKCFESFGLKGESNFGDIVSAIFNR